MEMIDILCCDMYKKNLVSSTFTWWISYDYKSLEYCPSYDGRLYIVIPASYYFEWEHFKSADGKTKTGGKYAIQPKSMTGCLSYFQKKELMTG